MGRTRRIGIFGWALLLLAHAVHAGQPAIAEPPKPAPGFFHVLTPAFSVESQISKAHADKVATMVRNAEQRFYTLFKLTPDLMNGVSKQKFDMKANIPGTVFSEIGFRPFIDVRVYKDMDGFADEWFNLAGIKDPAERMKTGLPGAYFSIAPDPYGTLYIRKIRTFVANRDDDELERTLLHEMGHLFMHSYLLEFAGDGGKGKESEKRGTPSWLSEGVAQLFENLWSNASSAQKARMRQQAMIYEAVKIGDSYPFKDFTNITNAHNLAAVAGDPLKATLNYAQSYSVMDYFVNVDGARFFSFLENLRALNFEKNLRNTDKNKIRELFTHQEAAFKKAYNADLPQVEEYWKKHIVKTMDAQLKKQPELYYWIGEYYLRRGKKKDEELVKAEANFKQAMTLAPTKGEGYLGMGRMAIRKKENEAALPLLEKAAKLLPKDDEAWYYLGMAQVNNGKLKEAVESFNTSLKFYPRSERALGGLALAAFHSRQFDQAIAAYEQAYQASRNPYLLFQKGQAAFFGKKYQLAQQSFASFATVFPMDPQGALWYGLSAWRLGDKEFAVKKMEEAAKLQPADEMIGAALAMAKKGETITFEREKEDEAVIAAAAAGKPEEKPKQNQKKPVMLDDE